MKKLPLKMKFFLGFVYIVTVISVIFYYKAGYLNVSNVDYKGIVFFAILTAITETAVVVFRGITFSTGFSVTLASYILFGPATAIIITIIGFLLRVLKRDGKLFTVFNTPLYKTLFNICTFILLILYSNYFYITCGGSYISDVGSDVFQYALQLLVFCLIYFILNTIIISGLFSCISDKGFVSIFVNTIKLGLISNLAMAPFGLIIAYLYTNSIIGILMFLCPIVLAKVTFSLYIESKDKFIHTVDALMRAIEARDNYTEGHSQRVADIVESIGKAMKYNDSKLEYLRIASLMHDVGKIGIDDAILNKPGKLTDEEYATIKKHPVIGYNILKDVKDLEPILNLVKYHHERYDGKGYPDGKTADELSIDVFIIQLADSVDAMATDRPYRKALSEEKIIDELIRCSGTQFHPKVVEAYLKTKGIDMKALEMEKKLEEKKGDTLCS